MEHLEDSENWNFSTIYENKEKQQKFKELYKQKKGKEYGINPDSIVIHRFIEGSIKVEWSTVSQSDQ